MELPPVCSGSTQAIDRRAVSWNQYVLHSRHMKHPYLDGIRTRRDVLLRRELRNGMNIRQPCYICPFCGFQTPFLVQHWLTHATRRLPPRTCDVMPGEQQRSATHTCTQECHEERQARAGCSHPFVKHLSRLFCQAGIGCTAEFLPHGARNSCICILCLQFLARHSTDRKRSSLQSTDAFSVQRLHV